MRPAVRIFAIIFLAALCLCCGCKKKSHVKSPHSSTPPAEANNTTNAPTPSDGIGEFKNYTLVVPPSGPRIWAAEVKSGKADSKTGKLILSEITCHMYDHGNEVLKVTANSAQVAINGKTVQADLSGNVLGTDLKRGQRITTNALRWNSKENMIHADKFYWIGEGMSVKADTGTFSSDLTEADFHGNVRMETTGVRTRR